MKKILLGMFALTSFALAAQEQMLEIHYTDGNVDLKKVSEISKITFSKSQTGETGSDTPVMVDLGLSVKWATFNVGATKSSEYGNFYAYGEIEPKEEYTLENYQWYYPDYDEWDCDEWEKYFKLGATFTGTNYDVAHVKWGDQWRVPTKDEWDELIGGCSWQWTAVDGVAGMMGTSTVNGNQIFLPAAGNMVDADHTHDQTGCFFWSSTEYIQDDISEECRNYRANLDNTYQSCDGYDYPEVGFSIRPVYGPVPEETLESGTIPSTDEMVDLGLSVKWAPFNIGASSARSDGFFLCWGELTEKQYSHVYNYKWYDPIADDYDYGDMSVDICDSEYDPANVLWGNGWRLPSKAEMDELVNDCTWEADTYGYTVTGPNGNSIYLKASGMMTYKGAPRSSYSEPGYYMSGTRDNRYSNYLQSEMKSIAYCIRFSRGVGNALTAPTVTSCSTAGGIQVRPVHE